MIGGYIEKPMGAESFAKLKTGSSFWTPVVLVLLVSTAAVYAPVFTGRVPLPTFFIYEFPTFAPSAPPGVSDRVPDIGDLITQFYPYRTLAARAVRGGELPMWNPYMTSGTVFLGNPLSALFYPPNALYYVLPVAAAWTLGFLLRTFLSGLFTALFLRRIGATSTGALVAALLFTFGGFMTVWQGQTMPDAAIWLPLICYSIVRLHADRSKSSVVIAAFAFAMPALAGHPETSAHLTLTGTILAAFLGFFRPVAGLPRRNLRFIACFGSAAILALGIASIQLFPTLEWFANAYRGLEPVWPPAPVWSILGLVSRDVVRSTNSFGLQVPVQATYIGMLAFIAAPAALLSSSRRFVVFFSFLTAAGLCIAYGIGPLFEASRYVPFFKTLKNDRLMMMVTFGGAVLAGLGVSAVEQLKQNMRHQRFRAAMLGLIGFYTASAMIYLVQVLTDAPPPHWRSPEASFLLLLASAAVLAWKLGGGLRGAWFQLAICIVLGADVCTFAYRVIPFDKAPNIFPPNELFSRLAALDQAPFRMTQLGSAFPENIQLVYGLFESGGYEIPLARIKKFGESIAREEMDSMVFDTEPVLESKDRRADLLNTKYYLVSRYDPSYRKFLERKDRFQFRFEYANTSVFENLKAFPAAFLVGANGINTIPYEKDQLAKITDPSFDPATSVILPEPMTVSSAARHSSNTGMVRWIARRNNSFRLNVETQNESVLVISQTYYPGWKAWIDGQETRIVPADYALTGIIVGAGSHDVRFSYEPMSFRIGLTISLASLLVAILLVGIRRARSQAEKQ